MGKISSYASDSNISASDKLIGTDADNNDATKNYLISDLMDYIVANVLNGYVPYSGASENVNLGGFVIIAQSGQFASGLELGANCPLYLNGEEGAIDQLLVSQGAGLAPRWVNKAAYGSFYDTTIQTAALADTGYAVTLGATNVDATSGISIASSTQITFTQTGVYDISASIQLYRLAGGASPETIFVWLRKGGVDVANSARAFSVQPEISFLSVTANFFIQIDTDAVDPYVELMWSTTSTDVELAAFPLTPSASVTVTQVSL